MQQQSYIPQSQIDVFWSDVAASVARGDYPKAQKQVERGAASAEEGAICNAAERAAKEAGATLTAAAEWAKDAAVVLKAAQQVCDLWDVDLPESASGQDAEIMRKVLDVMWWRRQLRKQMARKLEHAAIRAGVVGKGKQPYLSDESVLRQHKRNIANRKALEAAKVRNENGDEFTVAALADKGTGNKAKRRGELMTRIRGFEEIAQLMNHAALFWTVTCPSKFHSVGGTNQKYNGASPRDAQRYLRDVWARIRAELDRVGIRPYGFRVVEPHTDGCPHWHMLFFVERKDVQRMEKIVYSYAMQEDGTEPGAEENRVKLVNIEHGNGGSAAAYIAKYISKNIDGEGVGEHKAFEHGEEITVQAGKVEEFTITPSMRVSYWSQVWGIRQFQQIGGVPVGIWREFRRIKAEKVQGAPDSVRNAWEAAQAVKSEIEGEGKQADYCGFMQALGGARVGRGALVQLYKETVIVEGRYATYEEKRPVGVYAVEEPDVIYQAVHYRWERINGGNSVPLPVGLLPPRTGVNNCTDGNATAERIRFEIEAEEAKKIKISAPAWVDWPGINRKAREIEKESQKFAWRRGNSA